MNPLPPRRSAAACTSAPKLVLAALLLALGIDSAHSAIVTLDAGNPGTGSALWLDSAGRRGNAGAQRSATACWGRTP